jgi:hypothetical protein
VWSEFLAAECDREPLAKALGLRLPIFRQCRNPICTTAEEKPRSLSRFRARRAQDVRLLASEDARDFESNHADVESGIEEFG